MHGPLAKILGPLMIAFLLVNGMTMLISPRRWHRSRWGGKGVGGSEYLDNRLVVLVYRAMGVISVLVAAFIASRLIVDG